jgi:hypothetical protein
MSPLLVIFMTCLAASFDDNRNLGDLRNEGMTYSLRPMVRARDHRSAAGVRTVAHVFEPRVYKRRIKWEPVLAGERKLSLARQGGLTLRTTPADPPWNRWARFLSRLRRRRPARCDDARCGNVRVNRLRPLTLGIAYLYCGVRGSLSACGGRCAGNNSPQPDVVRPKPEFEEPNPVDLGR